MADLNDTIETLVRMLAASFDVVSKLTTDLRQAQSLHNDDRYAWHTELVELRDKRDQDQRSIDSLTKQRNGYSADYDSMKAQLEQVTAERDQARQRAEDHRATAIRFEAQVLDLKTQLDRADETFADMSAQLKGREY